MVERWKAGFGASGLVEIIERDAAGLVSVERVPQRERAGRLSRMEGRPTGGDDTTTGSGKGRTTIAKSRRGKVRQGPLA